MEKLNEKTLSKIYASYIGAKIELCQSRFTEDQQDRTFTLDGVCSDGFYVKEIEGVKYEFGANDSLVLFHLDDISDEDNIKLYKILGYNAEKGSLNAVLNFEYYGAIKFKGHQNWSFTTSVEMYQYLQSKRIALPYGEYSVDDLVKVGVYKIKK